MLSFLALAMGMLAALNIEDTAQSTQLAAAFFALAALFRADDAVNEIRKVRRLLEEQQKAGKPPAVPSPFVPGRGNF